MIQWEDPAIGGARRDIGLYGLDKLVKSRSGAVAVLRGDPFPVPAHQTGRADFQHPAFRPASSYDPRRASIVRAHKMQNRKFCKHITKGEP